MESEFLRSIKSRLTAVAVAIFVLLVALVAFVTMVFVGDWNDKGSTEIVAANVEEKKTDEKEHTETNPVYEVLYGEEGMVVPGNKYIFYDQNGKKLYVEAGMCDIGGFDSDILVLSYRYAEEGGLWEWDCITEKESPIETVETDNESYIRLKFKQ